MIPIRKKQSNTEFYGTESAFAPKTIGRYTIKTDTLLLCQHLFCGDKELFSADRILEVDTERQKAIGADFFGEFHLYDLKTEQLCLVTADLDYARTADPKPPYVIF